MSPGALQRLRCVAGVACWVAMSMPQGHIVSYCLGLGFGAARGAQILLLMLGMGIVSRLLSGWALFGPVQGGIVPSYAPVMRGHFTPPKAGARVGAVLMAALLGMALGGRMSGAIFDATGSHRATFGNGIAGNLLSVSIVSFLLLRLA